MGIPKLLKTAEEVTAEYNRKQDDRQCSDNGLIHQIDTSGSCQCGYFIDGKPGGSFPFIPNRSSRRRLSSHKRGTYVKTDEDYRRMAEERERDQTRREVRKLARLSQREISENQPTLAVDLLVSAEVGTTEEDQA